MDVLNEGFKPLKKSHTLASTETSNGSEAEPTALPSKPFLNRGMSLEYNATTGEKMTSKTLWEESSWQKLGRSRGQTMDRANSFIGHRSRSQSEAIPVVQGAVVVVDPYSTGAHLAAAVCAAGYKCIKVLSSWDSPVASLVQAGVTMDFAATIQYNDKLEDEEEALEEATKALRELPFEVLAVIPGAEPGVELADQLSYRLGLRTNGVGGSLARRHKYHMGEKVRSAGVRAVTQVNCTSMEEMKTFLADLAARSGHGRCVVKPVQSAGSDDVFLCSNIEEAVTAFGRIHMKQNGLGLTNESVLVQEFLVGKEYVVDKVSRDGEHKLVAIWAYDKRKVNNADFVYFGMKLMPCDTQLAKVMSAYADKVLDALDINNGPSHMEIMVNTITGTDGEKVYDPCLVEVGSRCHGGEGTWIPATNECIGYTQVSITLDAYLSGHHFAQIDKDRYPMRKAAREVDLVSRRGGIMRGKPGEAAIRALPSFRSICWEVKPGDYVPLTVDCFTRPGCVQLVSETEEQADKDFEAIHDLEELNLIDYSIICPKPPSIGAIVVVDPFSSGANLAAMVLQWGYKLILVFSELDSPVASMVSKGTNVNPTLMVQHDNNHPNQDFAVQATIKEIESQGSPVLAILPGAETGVELAERLSSRYGTRSNGEEHIDARRNKFNMQESIRAAKKIRAVQQALCRTKEQVEDFLKLLKETSPTKTSKFVVKPNESAGSDSVYLCETLEEAVKAFGDIHNHTNGLGDLNDGALVQEFLTGTEFVVDGVSRDGVYKITAVWEYDKRSINGANFVYFGMRLRETVTPEIRALIEYAKEVVRILGIHQGPSHMELMSCLSDTGAFSPCLVEVGARCHGGDATWLPVVQECIGYSQLDATLNAYLRADRFDAMPFEPKLTKQGCEAFLVSYDTGYVKDIPGINEIRSYDSFRRMEMMTQPGARIQPTIDCFTRPGSVQLVNSSGDKLTEDYQRIRKLESSGLFEVA